MSPTNLLNQPFFNILAVILVMGCLVQSITTATVPDPKQETQISSNSSFYSDICKARKVCDEYLSRVGQKSPATHHKRRNEKVSKNIIEIIIDAIKVLQNAYTDLIGTLSINAEMKSELEKFNNTLNEVKTKLKENAEYSKEVQNVLRTLSRTEIVRSIQSHEFSDADVLLQFTQDYKHAASKVYNKTSQNFDLLISFGKSIQDSQRRFKVFEALYNEMKDNGHKDVWQLLQLSEELRNVTDPSTKASLSESQSLRKTLWNENQNEAIEPISLAFLNETFAEEVGHLGSEISDACLQCIGDIYQKVMDKVLDNVNAPTVLYRASKLIFVGIHESIFIHEAVFNKLVKNGELYKNTALSLAYYMKMTMDNTTYQNATLEMKNRHADIKNKLPVSVRNVIFSSAVCIKNSGNNEFLFASGPEGAFENKTHSVYTRIPPGVKDVPAQFKWKVQFVDDELARIINVGNDEFLLASANALYNTERRLVYTFKTQNDSSVDLSFEVDGDGLNIKNKLYEEFLFADSAVKQNNARYVFTYIPKNGIVPMQSRWEAEDCSNFN